MVIRSPQAELLKEILESVSSKKNIVKPLPNEAEVSLVTQVISDELITRVIDNSLENDKTKPKVKKIKSKKKEEPVAELDKTELIASTSIGIFFLKSLCQGLGLGLGLAMVLALAWLIITDLSNAPRVVNFIQSLVK